MAQGRGGDVIARNAGIETSIAAAVAALGLERPEITELAGGVINRSFRMRDRDHDLVLRISGRAATGLGADRGSECAIQALAANAGLAPKIVLANAARGFIVSRHVAGSVPDASAMREPQLLRRAGKWIAQLHELSPPCGLPAVDFGERATGYLARAMAQRPDAFVGSLARELARRRAALARPARLAACHHDLHRRNFLDDGRHLWVVDWEYAGPGDTAADLASFIGYQDLDAAGIDALLAGYGDESAGFRARIAALCWVFDCLWYGWNAAAALAGLETDREGQARLAARLAP